MVHSTSSDDDEGNHGLELQAPLQVLRRRQTLLLRLVTIRAAHTPRRLHRRRQALRCRRRPCPPLLLRLHQGCLRPPRQGHMLHPVPGGPIWQDPPTATRSPSPSASSSSGTRSPSPPEASPSAPTPTPPWLPTSSKARVKDCTRPN